MLTEATAMPKECEYNLFQLIQLREEYLRQGAVIFNDLALIARELGERTFFRGRSEPWYIVDLPEPKITLYYEIKTIDYNPWTHQWNREENIAAMVGMPAKYFGREYSVCNLIRRIGSKEITGLFVPGHWLEIIHGLLERAKETRRARLEAGADEKRLKLMQELLIGKEV